MAGQLLAPGETFEFSYYLHDDTTSSERRDHMESRGVALTEEAWENVGRPFYEVELRCKVDDRGTVTILGAVST
jgi:hypothetical protein